MELPEIVPISSRGALVAAVSRDRIHILAPWLISRPAGDPELRFVAMMCVYGCQVLARELSGQYSDEGAEEWARAALIDRDVLDSVAPNSHALAAATLGVPLEQIVTASGTHRPGPLPASGP